MRVLITGSWLQHNTEVVFSAMAAAELVDIEPTAIVTGCWVGADQLGVIYAKANGLDRTFSELHKEVLPSDIDAAIILTHRGDHDVKWIVDSCEILGIPCVVW